MTKSFKRLVRDAVIADLESAIRNQIGNIPIVNAFDGEELRELHIRVAVPSAVPKIPGGLNYGVWSATVVITVASSIDATDIDIHDDLAGMVEAYAVQANVTIASALTGSELTVGNANTGEGREMAIGKMRMSAQEIELADCTADLT